MMLVLILYFFWLRYMRNQKGIAAKVKQGIQTFNIKVLGVYSPSVIKAKVGLPVQINFRREESNECSRYVNFPDFKIRKELPEGQTVTIQFTPSRKGEFIFTCDMSMYQGRLIVE